MASGSEKSLRKELVLQGRKTAEEEIYWKYMKNVRFLVVLTGNFQQKLSIPKKFAENMKAIILNPKITLHGPSGISWDVALMMGADGLFLQEGWEEFVLAHSLQENDALIFKYDRKASFRVKIFNGECEKEASYFVKKCGHVIQAIEHQKEGDSSEIVEEADGDDEAAGTPSKKTRVRVGIEAGERQEGHDMTETNVTLRKRKPVQRAVNVLRKKMLRSSKKPPEPVSNTEPEGAKESNQDSPANKDMPSQDQNSPGTNGNVPESNLDKGLSVTRRRPRKCSASVKRFTSPAEPEGAEEPNQDSSARKDVPSQDQNSPEMNRHDPESNLDKGLSVTRSKQRKCAASEKKLTSPAEPGSAEEPDQDSPARKDVPSQDQNTPETNGNDPEGNLDKGLSVTRGGSRKYTASVKRFSSPAEPGSAEEPNQDSPARKDVPSQDQNTPETNGNDPESNLDKGLSVTRRRPRKCSASVKRFSSPAEPGSAEEPNQDSPARKDVPSQDQNTPETNGNDPESNLDKGLSVTRGGSRKYTSSVKRFSSPVECYISNRRPVTEEEKNEALRLALENLTEESFIAIMRYTSCYKGFSMSIPSKWAQEFLGPKNQAVVLRMGEKTWPTRYCFSRRALGNGWKQFALENNLEEFDTCLFKLVSPDYAEVMLDVTIYRVVEDVAPPTRQ